MAITSHLPTETKQVPAPWTPPAHRRQTVIVVGNGMTSWRLCHELVESGASRHLRIIVIGDEPLPAYDRVRLTSLLGGGTIDELLLARREWYEDVGIELHLGDPVVGVDANDCAVRTAAGRELLYDRLILATGAAPFVPPIRGIEQSGVFVYRKVADVVAIRDYAAGRRRAIVLGGGLLGLEAARAARDLGLEVSVIEAAPRLMPRQLDDAGAAHLTRAIERLGVRVFTGSRPVAIEGKGSERTVFCEGGRRLRGDLVVLAAGVRPASALAKEAGLVLGRDGGVLVDEQLRTSDERIFAVGDCAVHGGASYGLVAPGYQMVRVLVSNLVGAEARLDRQWPVARLKLLGVDVASVGDLAEGDGARTVVFEDDRHYRKLVLRGGRLAGASCVGPWSGFDGVAEAIAARRHPSAGELRRFVRAGDLGDRRPASAARTGALVCSCLGVTRGQIDDAIAAGCSDAAAISRRTAAGTLCGGCRPALAQLCAGRSSPAAPSELRLPVRPVRVTEAPGKRALGLAIGSGLFTPSTAAPVVAFRRPLLAAVRVARRQTMPPFVTVPGSPPIKPAGLMAPLSQGRSLVLLALVLLALALLALVLSAPVLPRLAALVPPPSARGLRLVTGFLTLGLAAAALALWARKRVRRLAVGSFSVWRNLHAAFGVASIASLAMHTGLQTGAQLNRVLLATYLVALFGGTVVAVTGPRGGRAGGRPWVLYLHVAAVLPLPALLALHIVAAYFYG